MTEEENVLTEEFADDDIFFECPRCGKSMGIAKAGIGMVVRCLDCELAITVPALGDDAEHADETAMEDAKGKEAPSHFNAEFTLKREKLDLLFDEIVLIQRSLDSIVATLENSD